MPRSRTLAISLIVALTVPAFWAMAVPAAPLERSTGLWWEEFPFDADGDKVDDRLEELVASAITEGDPDRLLPVFVDLPRIPTAEDKDLVASFGAVSMNGLKHMEMITALLPASKIHALARSDAVGMIEWEPPSIKTLSVSSAAIKAKPSGVYSPNTAWERGFRGQGMVIGVIDTGVNDAHNFFKPLSSGAPKWIAGADFVGTDRFCVNPPDEDGHGTHVASTSLGNGGTNTYPYGANAGVAPEAQLVEFRISEQLTAESGAIVGSIDWAIDWNAKIDAGIAPCPGITLDQRIDVLTLSFGSVGNGGNGRTGQPATINKAVSKGIAFTVAAGNCGPSVGNVLCPPPFNGPDHTVGSPATADGAITVANSDDRNTINRADDTISGSSSRGPRDDDGDADSFDELKPEIAAPGTSIVAARHDSNTGTVSMSGTSMAAPHVGGVAALILQANPTCRPSERSPVTGSNLWNNKLNNPVLDVLIKSAEFKSGGNTNAVGKYGRSWNNAFGYGLVDVDAALTEAISGTACDTLGGPLRALAGGSYLGVAGESFSLAGSARGGTPPYTYLWTPDPGCTVTDPTSPTSSVTCAAVGTYSVTLDVTDAASATAGDTASLVIGSRATLFSDGFESGAPGWTVANADPQVAVWHLVERNAASPTHAWYDGLDGAERYVPEQDTTLVSPTVDLTAALQATLRYSLAGNREDGYDYMIVSYRVGAGAWQELERVSGLFSAHTVREVSMDAAIGTSVQIGFRSTSDENLEESGYYVDDVSVEIVVGPPDVIPPSQVTGLTVTNPGDGASLSLTWDPATDNNAVANYRVYRSTTTGPVGDKDQIAVVSDTAFLDTGLTSGTTYFYQVAAVDTSANVGLASSEASGTPIAIPDTTPPTAPASIGVFPLGRSGWLRAEWGPANDDRGLSHYEVERNSGSGFVPLGTTANRYWAEAGLTDGQSYTYRVRAVDTSSNIGPYSAEASGIPVAGAADWPMFHRDAGRTGASGALGWMPSAEVLQQLSAGGAIRSSPLAADLDGDGDLEIVVVSDMIEASGRVTVTAYRADATQDPPFVQMWRHVAPPSDTYLGNPQTGFHPNEGYGSAAIGDLTGDGLPEIALLYNYMQRARVSLNDGHVAILDGVTGAKISGVPNPEVVIALQNHPVIGDIDGDGANELVLHHQVGGTEGGYFITGFDYAPTEMVTIFDSLLAGSSIGSTAGLFIVANPVLVDADRTRPGLEIVVAADGSDNTAVVPGRVWLCRPTSGDAGCGSGVSTPLGVRGIAAADLDGDGSVEIVANSREGASLSVITTDGGVLSVVSRAAGYLWNTPVLADMDNDGVLDILNVEHSELNSDPGKVGNVHVHGYQPGTILAKQTMAGTPLSSSPGGAAAADLDADGTIDMVFGSLDGQVRAITFAHAGGPLSLWTYQLEAQIRAPIALADVDGDGRLEALVGDELGRLTVLTHENLPPAQNAIGQVNVREGQVAAFRAEATDEERDPITWTIRNKPGAATFTDNGDGTADFSWQTGPADAGEHKVTVVASDGAKSSEQEVTILVSNENFPPTASFTMSPTSGVTKDTRVTATDTSTDSDGTVVGRSWQVSLIQDSTPDGVFDTPGAVVATGTGASISFNAPDDGEYEVRLTVTDNEGATGIATRTLVVNNIAPVLIATAPAYARPGVAANFVDYSIDRDGGIAARHWDTNGDGTFELVNAPANAQYAYPAAGTFQARLVIEDTDGATATKTFQVIVDGTPPVTTATYPSAPASGYYGGPVDVRFSRSDSGGSGMHSTSVKINGVGTPRSGFADFTVRIAGEGTHVVEYFSQDRAGNIEASRTFEVRIDTAAPIVKIIEPAAVLLPAGPALHGGVFLAGDTINIRAGASDAGSGIARVDFYVGAELIGSDSTAADGYRASWDTSGRNTGSYELRAYAFDNAGRSAFSAEAVMLVATPEQQSAQAGVSYGASNDCSVHLGVACEGGDSASASAGSDGGAGVVFPSDMWSAGHTAGAAAGYLADGAEGGDAAAGGNAGLNGRGCEAGVSVESGPDADCSSVAAGSASASITGANDCGTHLPVACNAGETVALTFGDGVMLIDGFDNPWAPGQAVGAWAGFLSDGGQGGHGPVSVTGEANGMSCTVQTWGGPLSAAVPRFDCVLA